jgi:hypothetical protein
MSNFHSKWKQFLQEAQQDAKVLRSLNIKAMQKEVPQGPEEQPREYFTRLQGMEADPEYLNPIFPQGLVTWMESLPDNHFPRDGRKRFAKWLANAVYIHETELYVRNIDTIDKPEELSIHNNDIRYISDYLNGASEFPEDLWKKSLNGMFDLAHVWHHTLKGKESTGDYQGKEIVYSFENGFTIVDVNTENDLDVEGDKMGHCVGSYCDDVATGRTTIYSLRDARNEPHATIEVVPTLPLGRSRSRGKVEQIKGKGNASPIEKYRPMIKQWLQTTDFEYENSPDYLNILSSDEVKEKLFAGELNKDSERSLAYHSDDPEIIEFFLDQMIIAGFTYGGTSSELVTKLNTSSITDYLLRNDNLNEEHRLTLVKTNFKLRHSVLGVRMSRLLGAMGHTGTRNFDPASLSSRVWEELGAELTSGYSDEKLYCMQALMEVHEAPDSIKEEIINHLLSDKYVNGAVKQSIHTLNQQQQPYGAILQGYLFHKSPSSEQVKRLYTIQRDDRFLEILGHLGRLNGYIASSRGMTDDLADEIIEDVKTGKRYAFIQSNWIDMVMNPRLSDSKKIELLNIGGKERGITALVQPQARPSARGESSSQFSGLKWSISGRSISRQLVTAAREKKFSKRLVKYMIDSGIFDPQYVMVWVGQRTKLTGRAQDLSKFDENEKQKVLAIARSRALQEFESGLFDEELFQEVNNYFRKNIMTKNAFYDNIKEQIGINEEKGRSRQRGIYKFYCMIAYGLTTEGEKSRGLDDILADMRALPNVTIVTVAIRNQKVSEGRYIAGLAIKFIPSTPGDMNTPENVKARIVRDIKRLANVHSLFKLSTGLTRLE